MRRKLTAASIGIVLSLLAFALAPMFHWFWYGVIYRHPVGLGLIGLWLFTTFVVAFATAEKMTHRFDKSQEFFNFRPVLIGSVFVGGLILVIAYGIFANALTQYRLVHSLDVETIQSLPNTNTTRMLPFEVAETYGQNKFQESLYEFGDFDPIQLDSGEVAWVTPLIPSGFPRTWTGQQDGFAIIHQDGTVEQIREPMKYGEGMRLRDNIYWVLHRQNYFVEKSEIYYLQLDDEIVAVAPYIDYDFQFPVQVSVWGGVFLVHTDGAIEDLSPEEAQADSRLTGQHIYPLELAGKISKAWAYEGGIWNKWFVHVDQTEVAKLEESPNQFPFLLPTEDGEQWFTALKPRGKKAQGIYKMLYVDAFTGQVKLYELPLDKALAGPNRANDYVVSAYDRNWERSESKSGTDIVIEPRPVVREGELFWLYSVTTRRYAGVTFTVVVNAKTPEDVRSLETFEQVQAFIDGTYDGEPVTSSANTSPDPTTEPGESTTGEYSGRTNQELLQMLNDIIDELNRREEGGS